MLFKIACGIMHCITICIVQIIIGCDVLTFDFSNHVISDFSQNIFASFAALCGSPSLTGIKLKLCC